MARFKSHLCMLRAARSNAVAYRRQVAEALSKPYEKGETEEKQERFVTIQKLIEAIDRAVADEERIEQLAGPMDAGRADEQKAASDAPAEPLESSRIAQELNDLVRSWSTGNCTTFSATTSPLLSGSPSPPQWASDAAKARLELKRKLKKFLRDAARNWPNLQHEGSAEEKKKACRLRDAPAGGAPDDPAAVTGARRNGRRVTDRR